MILWQRVVTRAQGFVTSQFLSFISVCLSWVRRGNAGAYKVINDTGLCFMIIHSCWSCVSLFVSFRSFLGFAYTLYTH